MRKGHECKRSAVTSLALMVLLSVIASVPNNSMWVCSDVYVVGVTLQLKGAIFILEPVGKGSMFRVILTILVKI